jgi:hypothetical protein
LAEGLRDSGVDASIKAVAASDAVYGALSTFANSTTPAQGRLGLARHAIAVAVPLSGAPVLLWLLLQTGVAVGDAQSAVSRYPPPAYLYTIWSAWSMVAVLVFLGAIGLALLQADWRLRRPAEDAERARRRMLARGIRIAAAATVAAALVTTMLGTATYQLIPVWYLLLWAVGPTTVLAAAATLIAGLVQHGYTSVVRWQIWLRIPNTTVVLMVAGLVAIESYLYTSASYHAIGSRLHLPDGVDLLGTIAAALAILPLASRYLDRQVIASPFVVAIVIWTHSYTNMTVVIAALLGAVVLWWFTRIRPAAAYADPEHRATILAAQAERLSESAQHS